MKLESLKNGKFEQLDQQSMKYIVGGAACTTAGGTKVVTSTESFKYSSDVTDRNSNGQATSTTYYGPTNANDNPKAIDDCPVQTSMSGGYK